MWSTVNDIKCRHWKNKAWVSCQICNVLRARHKPSISHQSTLNTTKKMYIWKDSNARQKMLTLYRGIFFTAAPALQTASDTARIAFAPSWTQETISQKKQTCTLRMCAYAQAKCSSNCTFCLHQPHSFWVPSSSSTMNLSIPFWSVGSCSTTK